MAHPLFIPDGYTVTETVPAHDNGWYPEFEVEYRPVVGEAQEEYLEKIRSGGTLKEREAMYLELLTQRVKTVAGQAVDKKLLESMHTHARQRIVNRVLVIDDEVRIKMSDAAKNSAAG